MTIASYPGFWRASGPFIGSIENVPPKFTVDDVTYGAGRNVVTPRDAFNRFSIGPRFAGLANAVLGHFCFAVLFTNPNANAAFSRLVHHVVGLRPEKQMVRVAARRIVAAVQNVKVANRSDKNLVRKAMRSFLFKSPISARVQTAGPLPTTIFGNMKPGNQVNCKGYVGGHKRRLALLSVMSNV